MSITTEQSHLNSMGLVVQASLASVMVNLFVHPLCTIKTRQMAGNLGIWKAITPLRGLYNGYVAIVSAELFSYSTIYVTNHLLQGRVSDLGASIMAGVISTPVVAFGEGLMANRQVNAMPYSQVFRRAVRPAGLITTGLREVPFAVAVIYLTPLLEKHLQNISRSYKRSFLGDKAIEVTAGVIAGSVSGFLTTPIDLIKTRVQTSEQPLPIKRAVTLAYANHGLKGFFVGSSARVLYVGIAVACMNLVNHALPPLLPATLKTHN